MAVIQFVISAVDAKALRVPAKGLLKIRPSPHSSLTSPPFTKVLWQVSCWWHHRCWIRCQKPLLADLHPLWLSSNWGHLRPKERRGARGVRGRGALHRAGTSDPCVGLFVWTTGECPSCHQLEKTLIMCVKSVCGLQSVDVVHVRDRISVLETWQWNLHVFETSCQT